MKVENVFHFPFSTFNSPGEAQQKANTPVRIFIEGRVANAAASNDYEPNTASNGHVAVVLGGTKADGSAAVSVALARACKYGAHVKLGNGQNGALSVQQVYIGTQRMEDRTDMETLHDAGFLTFMHPCAGRASARGPGRNPCNSCTPFCTSRPGCRPLQRQKGRNRAQIDSAFWRDDRPCRPLPRERSTGKQSFCESGSEKSPNPQRASACGKLFKKEVLMPIKYSLSQQRNPQDPDGPRKFYAKAQATGEVDIDSLAEEIAYATSLTDGDVINAIRALVKRIIYHVSEGRIVRVETLGDFRPSISSEGADTEEAFNDSLIRRVKIIFRPGDGIQAAFRTENLKFKKAVPLKDIEALEGGEETPGA